MQYNSWIYLFPFLGFTVLFYYIMPLKHRWKVLLTSSLLFYWLACKWLLFYVVFSAGTVYFVGLKIAELKKKWKEAKTYLDKDGRKEYKKWTQRKEKHWIIAACLVNFGLLFFCKYFNFLGENLNQLFQTLSFSLRIPHLSILIPLGISFYTMAAISYVTDVSRGNIETERNYGRLLLFLIFFPVITEGPIEKYENLGKQLKETHTFDFQNFCFGWQLIVWGLFQKVVLADRVNVFVSAIFSKSHLYSGIPVIFAILLYTFQLYMDFAGCIDIARGSAQLFGIRLTENFRRPFCATSVSEFWRRWHISLGTWFRDYIFYPVSFSTAFQKLSKYCRNHMSRYYAATIPGIFALFCVWFSTGIWHGAEWKYIVYGLYYYIIMVAGMLAEPMFSALFEKIPINRNGRGYHFLQQCRTFLFVNIGMLIFRAKDLKTAWSMLLSVQEPYAFKNGFFQWICHLGGLRKLDLLLILSSIVFLIFYGRYKEKGGNMRLALSKQFIGIRWAVYLLSVLAVILIGAYGPGFGVADFIYAQF